MNINNPKHTLRLYNHLCFEHIRRNQLALKSSSQYIYWDGIGSLFLGIVVYTTPRPQYVAVPSLVHQLINIAIVATPLIVSYIMTTAWQRRMKQGQIAPIFHLALGHIDAIVPTGVTMQGSRSWNGTKVMFKYILSRTDLITLSPGGKLDYECHSIQHIVTATHPYFYTHDSAPSPDADMIFLWDNTWKYGTPFEFDTLDRKVLDYRQKQREQRISTK